MDEFMLANLTFNRSGMGGGMANSGEVGSVAKQKRNLTMRWKLALIPHIGGGVTGIN